MNLTHSAIMYFFRCSLFSLLLMLPLLLSSQTDYSKLKTLDHARISNFSHVPQTQTNWCWAATLAEVINSFRGTDFRACDIVSQYLNARACSAPAGTNVQNSLFAFQDIVAPHGLNARVLNRVDWQTITHELKYGRPVLIRIESQLGSGHFVVISGFDYAVWTDSGRERRSFIISDPMYGFFRGDPDLMGYSISWQELLDGNHLDYRARWTHTVLFSD